MAIYELEDRIYFDGAIAADAAEVEDTSTQDAEDLNQTEDNAEQSSENVSIAPDDTDSFENSDASSDSESDSEAEPGVDDVDISATDSSDIDIALEGIDNIELPDGFESDPNVIIVSTEADDYEDIINSANDNAIIIEYSSDDTLDSILQSLKDALGERQAVNIAIMETGSEDKDSTLTSTDLAGEDFLNELSELQTVDGEVNFIDLDSEDTDVSEDTLAEYFDLSSSVFDEQAADEPSEVIFINSSVMNAEEIVDDLPENAEIVYLESGENGIQQITDYLADKTDIDTIRIISHGNDGYIVLNGEIIDADYLAENSDVIAAWKNALSENADIMLYGCEVAGSEVGEAFVESLATLTGADVAAATFNTGGTEANWTLDYNYGDIEAVDLTIEGYEYQLANITVANNNDSGTGSLRQAIYDINPGGEITFASSMTITVNSELTIYKSMTISGKGIDNTIIQAAPTALSADHRVFHIEGESSRIEVVLENMTVRNGVRTEAGESGGGIYVWTNSGGVYLTLSSVKLLDNYASDHGGGLFMGIPGEGGNPCRLTMNNCVVEHNSVATGTGTGVWFGRVAGEQSSVMSDFYITNTTFSKNYLETTAGGEGSALYVDSIDEGEISKCTFDGNGKESTKIIGSGGAIYISLANNIDISDTTITDNYSLSLGGGVYVKNIDTLTFTSCTISNNKVGQSGGGLHITNSGVTFKDCTISDNNATAGAGGGITIDATTVTANYVAIFTNCIISDNNVVGKGGGVNIQSYYVTFTNCTISGNESISGGGICFSDAHRDSRLTVTNCTIDNNTAETGGGIYIGYYSSKSHNNRVSVASSTIAYNKATSYGGGIYVGDSAGSYDIVINNCTIAYNSAEIAGAGIRAKGESILMRNSIVANNTNTIDIDCSSNEIITDQGYNIVGTSNNFTAASTTYMKIADDVYQNNNGNGVKGVLRLDDTLRDNGGDTLTLKLNAGSFAAAALPAGSRYYNNSPSTDQTGAYRIGDYTSIGAVICEYSTLYYRTVAAGGTGSWSNTALWEYSADNSTWYAAFDAPTYLDNTITVRSGAVLTVNSNLKLDQTVINSGGTVVVGASNTLTIADGTGTDLSVAGTLTNRGAIVNSGSITVTGKYSHAGTISGAYLVYSGSSSTLEYSGSSRQTTSSYEFDTANGPANLIINNSSGVILSVNYTLSGNLGVDNGNFNVGTHSLTVSGDITISSSASISIGETHLNAASITSEGTITNSSGTITVTGDFISTGAITNSGTIEVAGAVTLPSGQIGGTFVYNGTTQTVDTDGTTYTDLTISATTATATGTLTTSNYLNIDSGKTLDAESINIGRFICNSGTISISGSATFYSISSIYSGTFIYDGGDQNIAASSSYYNLSLEGSGTKTISGTVSVRNQLTTAENITLTLSRSATLELEKTWTNNGSFSAGTNSTVKYTGYFDQTVVAVNYYNLEVKVRSGSYSKSLAGNVEVARDFTLNFRSDAEAYQFSIGDYTLTVNGTSTINQTLVIGSSGQFNANGALNVTGGLSNSGTINASGSVTLPSDSTIGGTFVYNGSGAQTIASATYTNLATSTGGIKTLGGDISVTGILTNDAATTLSLSEYTLSVGGSWLGEGSFDAGTGTVNYNGTADQIIRDLNYYSLAINGSGNKTISNDIDIEGNFTAGGTAEFVHNNHSVTYSGANQTVAQVDYYDLILSGSGFKSLEGETSVAQNITISGTSVTLNVGDYQLDIANALTIGSGQTLLISAGTVDVNGTFDAANGSVSFSGNGNLKLGAEVVSLGALSTDNGTVWYDGSTAQDILSTTYYNLKISDDGDASKTLAGDIEIKGNFTADGGTFVNNNKTVTYSGANQTVAKVTYYDLILSGSEHKSLEGTTVVANNITLSGTSVTLNVGEHSLEVTNEMTIGSGQELLITTGTVDVAGTFDATDGTVYFVNDGNLKLGGTVTSLGTLSTDAGTVWYDGTSDQDILGDTYYNLKIAGDGSVKTLAGDINIKGSFVVESGNFAHNDKTVTYDGSSQDIADVTYYNLVITGTGTANGTGDIIIDNNFELSKDLTVAGLLSVGGNSEIGGDITTGGNQSYDGTVSINDSLTLDAGDAGTITFGGAVSLGANTLTVGTGNTGAVAFNSTVDGAGGLDINTDDTVTFENAVGGSTALGSLKITQSGGTTFNGTVDAETLTVTDTTGTVEFNDSLTLTALNTTAQDYAVKILGGGEITNAVTFSNIGGVTIGDDASDNILFHGGITSTASIVANSIAGVITVDAGNSISFGDTYVTGNATLDGIISLGNVTLSDGVTFTLGTGGNGNITVESITGTEGGDDSNIIVNTNGSFDLIAHGGGITTGIGTVSITVGQLSTIDDEVNANGNFTKAGEGELKIETATFAANNLEINEGILTGGANVTASVHGNLVIAESGTFNAFGTTIVHGDWDNDNGGTFNHCNGEVQFNGNGTTSHIYGANQWNNIISEHQINKTLIFESDKTQDIAGWMSFIGELDGGDIENNAYSVKVNNLTSVLEDTHCYAVTFAEISNCNSSSTVIASFSVDKGGNNSNWTFKKYYVWDGYGKNGNWSDEDNWGTPGLPEGEDPDVIINTQVNDGDPLVIGSNIKVGNMAIVSEKVLDFSNAGTLTITGGLYNMNGSIISAAGVDVNIVSETVAGSETRVYTGIIACGGNLNIEANAIDITDDITAAEGKSITLNTVTAGGEDADEVGTGTITIYSDTEITTTGGGDIEFNGTIKGVVSDVGIWSSLTLNAGEGDNGGEVKIYGVEEEAPLGSLTVIAGNNSTYIYDNVYTTGDQSYTGHVVISDDVTIQTTYGNIAFNGSVSGANAGEEDVTIDAGTGSVTFYETVGADVSLGNLVISCSQGGTTFNNEVTAASLTISDGGVVDINAAVNLSGAFSSAGTTFDNTSGVITATGITINHSGDVIVAANLSSGAGNVDIDSDSNITINAAISTTSGNVNIDSTGQTVLDANSGFTSISGDITFGGDKNGGTVLYKDFEFGAGSTVTFNSALDSKDGESYSLNILGNAVFAGGVGETTALSTLSVSGETSISGTVNTTGVQNYTSAVTLTGDSTLAASEVTFVNTITGTTAGEESLTITGNAVFGGNIGATALEALSVSGTTILNESITLAAGTATFTGKVNSESGENNSLEITGNAVFESSVGADDSLSSLTVTGETAIGADVTTTETQTYGGATTLAADTVNLTGTTIIFGSTLDGSSALTISGDVSFSGDVGGETALTSLTVSGSTTLGANITTVGEQDYNDIELSGSGGNYTLTSTDSDITISGNITDSGSNSLTFNVSENATVSQSAGKSIEINGSLGKDGAGAFDTNGNDITAGGLIVSGGTFNSGNDGGTWNINGSVEIGLDAVFNATTGEFIVTGDWINNGTFNHNNSTVTIAGSSDHNVTSGESSFFNLRLNTEAMVNLLSDMTIENELVLSTGLLSVGTSTLILEADAVVTGASDSAMIVTNSTGNVRKKFTEAGEFVFTIGTGTYGSAVYTPITVEFTTGKFGGDAYLDVRVTDTKDPGNTSPSNFLNRYWTVESNGISAFNANVECTYAADDVVGSEAAMYFGKYDNGHWKKYSPANVKNHTISASGLTSFCTITGIDKSLDPDPVQDVNLINDGTQFRTMTPWTNVIDYESVFEEFDFIEIGSVSDGEYDINSTTVNELADKDEFRISIIAGVEFEGNEMRDLGEKQSGIESNTVSLAADSNGENSLNFHFSSFEHYRAQINGNADRLITDMCIDDNIVHDEMGIAFNFEECEDVVDFDTIAFYGEKHPVFKSELDFALEKI